MSVTTVAELKNAYYALVNRGEQNLVKLAQAKLRWERAALGQYTTPPRRGRK